MGPLSRPWPRPHWTWLAPVAGLALLLPFVASQNAWHEWSNYLWLVGQQGRSIEQLGHPTLFLHEPFAVFYPQYVFYGGTLWSVAGYLALVLGSDWAAYLVVLAGAFAMAYGGTWWLARQLSLDRATAHLPALVTVASPYLIVGNLYGRGDWAEAVALCALPLALAGALSLARSPRVGPAAVVAVVASCAVVAGSHNITLLWGGLFGAAVAAVAAWSAGRVPARRLGLIAGTAALGVGLDAWFLLPGALLAHDTQAFTAYSQLGFQTYDTLGMLLSPWPRKPSGGAEVLYPQAPVYALAWALAAGALARRAGRIERRAWLGLVTVLAALTTLILWHGLWTHFPQVLKTIQFAVRLQGYLALAVAGLVIVGLRAAGTRRRWLVAAWVAVAAQTAFAGYVAVTTDPLRRVSRHDVARATVGPSFSEGQQTQFLFRSGTMVARPGPVLAISPDDARSEHVTFTAPPAGGGRRYASNVAFSPLVRVSGDARVVGRDATGMAVLEVRHGGRPVTVEATAPASVKAGRAISLASLLVAAGAIALCALRRRRRHAR